MAMKAVTKWTQTFPGSYPETMRRQMWPLCCGASILSGFKQVYGATVDEIVQHINEVMAITPDFQIYAGEGFKPHLTFLTLNQGQTQSATIMEAVKKAGFVKFGEGKPRGGVQSFFVRDTSNTFNTELLQRGQPVDKKAAAA